MKWNDTEAEDLGDDVSDFELNCQTLDAGVMMEGQYFVQIVPDSIRVYENSIFI